MLDSLLDLRIPLLLPFFSFRISALILASISSGVSFIGALGFGVPGSLTSLRTTSSCLGLYSFLVKDPNSSSSFANCSFNGTSSSKYKSSRYFSYLSSNSCLALVSCGS